MLFIFSPGILFSCLYSWDVQHCPIENRLCVSESCRHAHNAIDHQGHTHNWHQYQQTNAMQAIVFIDPFNFVSRLSLSLSLFIFGHLYEHFVAFHGEKYFISNKSEMLVQCSPLFVIKTKLLLFQIYLAPPNHTYIWIFDSLWFGFGFCH